MSPLGKHSMWDGHLMLLYHEESQRRTCVSAWVRRGLDTGAQILYSEPVDEAPARALSGLLADQPDGLEALARGQIRVIPAGGATYDPGFLVGALEKASSEGYSSLRWSGNAVTAWEGTPPGRHAAVERATDALCRSRPLSVMCQYPFRESAGTVGPLSLVHGAGLREWMLRAVPLEDGLALAGELDVTNHDILVSLLRTATTAAGEGPFVVDLGGVEFLDVKGARALESGTGSYRSRGGRVRLQAPQPHVEQLIRVVGLHRGEGMRMAASA